MAQIGEGYNFHVTGLTHDERGYHNMTPPRSFRPIPLFTSAATGWAAGSTQ